LPVVWLVEAEEEAPDADAADPTLEPFVVVARAHWVPTPWPAPVRGALSQAQQLALVQAGVLAGWLARDEGLEDLSLTTPP
jgi:hypothetical protein